MQGYGSSALDWEPHKTIPDAPVQTAVVSRAAYCIYTLESQEMHEDMQGRISILVNSVG